LSIGKAIAITVSRDLWGDRLNYLLVAIAMFLKILVLHLLDVLKKQNKTHISL